MSGDALETLVRAAQRGDREAFAQLVRRFQDLAVASAYAQLRDPQLAEDAAQEAFLDAYLHVAQLREPRAFPGWLRRIVFKHCDRQRRRKRLPAVSLDEGLAELGNTSQQAEEALGERRNQALLRAAIEALPAPERMLVALHYIGGHQQALVADYLELPLATVKKRLHTARRRIQERTTDMLRDRFDALRPSRNPRFSETIRLFLAVRAGDLEAVRAVLDDHPDLVNAQEDWDRSESVAHDLPVATRATPLIRAAERGDLAMVDLLLERGADLDRDCSCPTGESALWAAVAGHRTPVARRLLERGADPNHAAFSGHTPLHVAALRGDEDLVILLLHHGADPERRSREDRRPVDWALLKGHHHVAGRLMMPSTSRAGEAAAEARPIVPVAEAGFWVTGIKALDLFAPIARGALVRVVGGAAVGRNVLLAELSHRVLRAQGGAAVWTLWERHDWEEGEVDEALAETGIGDGVRVLRARPEDSETQRRGLAERSLARAEELCRQGAPHVLLVFFEREGHAADIEALAPRLSTLRRGSITAVLVPPWRSVEGTTSPPTSLPIDVEIVLDPALAAIRHYPALDPLRCRSERPGAGPGDDEHRRIAEDARALLGRYRELVPDLALERPPELPAEARVVVERAVRLQAFLTQPFHTAEAFSGRPGADVPLAETLAGVRGILRGVYGGVDRIHFLYRGDISEVLGAAAASAGAAGARPRPTT